MVHLYIFNPARKIRLLTTLLYRGSKRILASADSATVLTATKPKKATATSLPFFKIALHSPQPPSTTVAPTSSPSGELLQDVDYYKEIETGSCVFQVENTLFKIHRILLLREPSAFGDMFCLPQQRSDVDDTCDDAPVKLSDTITQFRDFLWALYAPPNELYLECQIERLLNVAELTNKYCFSSFESWVIERIYVLAQEPTGPLRSASPEVCARMLNVAILCHHKQLQELITQHLISRILWYNTLPDSVIEIAEAHGLCTLQGVGYYRQLISMEAPATDDRRIVQPRFPSNMNTDKRMRFLSAHHSLLTLWDQLRATPPHIRPDGCLSHGECIATWHHMWHEAGAANESLRCGSADVLGRLKSVMIGLRKSMADTPSMTLQCKMAALEAITEARDVIINGLMDHFMETYSPPL